MRFKAMILALAFCIGPLASGAAPAEVRVDEEMDAAERQVRTRGRFPDAGAWEVTITPPSAPGETDDEGPPDAAPGGEAGSVGFPGQRFEDDAPAEGGAGADRVGAESGAPGEAGSGAESASKPLLPGRNSPPSAQTAAPAPATEGEGPAGPRYGFQVGAYRNKQSALELEKKLSASFSGVYLTRINSGGEPLYRVRVGRLRSQTEAAALGKNLKNAGYAAFPVSEHVGN